MLMVIAFTMFALLVVGWLLAPEKVTQVEITSVVVTSGATTAVPSAV